MMENTGFEYGEEYDSAEDSAYELEMNDEFGDFEAGEIMEYPDFRDELPDEMQDMGDISSEQDVQEEPVMFDEMLESNDISDKLLEPDIDNMTKEELIALREMLTGEKMDVPDEIPDYAFRWDGTPTHNTEWDGDESDPPDQPVKVLKRTR